MHEMKGNYLYIWNNPREKYFIASGLTFRDFASVFPKNGGVVLLNHQSNAGTYDSVSCFSYIKNADLTALLRENIYSWGDFYWADYRGSSFPHLAPEEIAELLYASHTAKLLRNSRIESLDNKFLVLSHDDGWYLRAFYSQWSNVKKVLAHKLQELSLKDQARLRNGDCAFWICKKGITSEPKTFDVDLIVNKKFNNSDPKISGRSKGPGRSMRSKGPG